MARIQSNLGLMTATFQVPITKRSLPTRGIQTSPTLWTEEKATRDSELWGNPDRFWVVENKLYDLTPFLKAHPGGSSWLELTKGQDITEHFISYHLNEDKARAVLSKYYVREAGQKQQQRFTFQQDGLYRRVKKRLLKTASVEEWQNTSKSVKDGCILLCIWVTIFLLMAISQSFSLAVICGALIHSLTGVAHNFLHMKDSYPFRFLWLTTGFSHLQQQQMHCLSHHSYPNTLIDFEIQALEPIIYYLKVSPKNSPFLWLFKEIMLIISMPLNILLKLVLLPLAKLRWPEWQYVVPILQLPVLWAITGQFEISLKLFLIVHMTYGFISMKLNFFGHRTGQEWTEGNEEIRDFGEHQVRASCDTVTDEATGLWSYIIYAGFNYHGVHHMFPTIDNYNLPKATAILEEEGAKMGLKINKIKNIQEGLMEIQKNYFHRKEWKKDQ